MTDEQEIGRVRRGRRPRRRSRARGCASVALVLVLVLLTAGGVAVWSVFYRPDNDVAAGKPVEVTIPRGAGTADIAGILSEAGVIRNANMFRLQAKQAGVDGELRNGSYELATGMPYDMVLERLRKGPDIVYYDVMIPAGFTIEQVAGRFAKQAKLSEVELLALLRTGASTYSKAHPNLAGSRDGSLQGFLFPDTYRVKAGTKPAAVVEMMLDRFDEQVSKVDLSYAKKKGFDLYDVLTIASIIDREAKIADEYPKVAAVIYNRIDKGMRLQMCSTVMYGLEPKPDRLTNDDLEHEHPFNTYIHDGLPPGPMGSPGLRAINAAANPAKEKYLYFVLTGKDGSQTFASTYDEFLEAKKKYKAVFGD